MCVTVERDLTKKLELSLGKIKILVNDQYRNKEKNEDGSEKEITYGEYVDKINKRALKEQKKIMKRKIQRKLKDEPDTPDSEEDDT